MVPFELPESSSALCHAYITPAHGPSTAHQHNGSSGSGIASKAAPPAPVKLSLRVSEVLRARIGGRSASYLEAVAGSTDGDNGYAQPSHLGHDTGSAASKEAPCLCAPVSVEHIVPLGIPHSLERSVRLLPPLRTHFAACTVASAHELLDACISSRGVTAYAASASPASTPVLSRQGVRISCALVPLAALTAIQPFGTLEPLVSFSQHASSRGGGTGNDSGRGSASSGSSPGAVAAASKGTGTQETGTGRTSIGSTGPGAGTGTGTGNAPIKLRCAEILEQRSLLRHLLPPSSFPDLDTWSWYTAVSLKGSQLVQRASTFSGRRAALISMKELGARRLQAVPLGQLLLDEAVLDSLSCCCRLSNGAHVQWVLPSSAAGGASDTANGAIQDPRVVTFTTMRSGDSGSPPTARDSASTSLVLHCGRAPMHSDTCTGASEVMDKTQACSDGAPASARAPQCSTLSSQLAMTCMPVGIDLVFACLVVQPEGAVDTTGMLPGPLLQAPAI